MLNHQRDPEGIPFSLDVSSTFDVLLVTSDPPNLPPFHQAFPRVVELVSLLTVPICAMAW